MNRQRKAPSKPRKPWPKDFKIPLERLHLARDPQNPLRTDWNSPQTKAALTARNNEIARRLMLLCDYYEVPRGEWLHLSYQLAQDFVPGFKEQGKPGRSQIWNSYLRGRLAYEVDAMIAKNSRLSVDSATKKLAKDDFWMKKIKGQNRAESLRKQYPMATESDRVLARRADDPSTDEYERILTKGIHW